MPAAVVSHRRCRGVRAVQVRRDGNRLLDLLAVNAELSIALVGDDEMRRLNARYRRKDRTTDVLSFGTTGGTRSAVSTGKRQPSRSQPLDAVQGRATFPPPALGDVVISIDTAVRQAADVGVSVDDEVRRLLTHGVLHLLGYDHERSAAEARRMFAKQRSLLRRLRTENCFTSKRRIRRSRRERR